MSRYLIAHIGHTTRSHEHIHWWRPDSRGYTFSIEHAGLYSEFEARAICRHGTCIAVLKEHVEKLARSTPYYRRSDGNLEPLYDLARPGVVPNGKVEWVAIMAARMDCGRVDKPTPRTASKARAIYLPGLPARNEKEGSTA
ncbi:hypothetical protein D8I35_05515 [Corticibacter populi]|uniref:Uncharacterized protein n=1 Tax=Corticibacter populi TaxID=1550736 RepID=A0A3M6QZT6_9BURK|nr:hypothetical protein [Corticibacter populi]RMX08534.1 hypothetical protein D8I35_05515 [Corticibacter populi]RZS35852.1 hypothetical protein EV687_0932 [Corticibacter populi]